MSLFNAMRRTIVDALIQTGGNIPAAAKLLEVPRTTLYRKVDEMMIEPAEYGGNQWAAARVDAKRKERARRRHEEMVAYMQTNLKERVAA